MASAARRWRERNPEKVETYNRARRVRPDYIWTHYVGDD
jgi:hypothetical protein